MFGPATVHIHPIFTQVEDWTEDGIPDGIEVLLELRDQFNEPTKATGRLLFELHEYRQGSLDPRGERLANPWIGSLRTLDEQSARWRRTFRAYKFQLAMPGISRSRHYVLSVMFRGAAGTRLFDRIILEPQTPPPAFDWKPAPTIPPSATLPALPATLPTATLPTGTLPATTVPTTMPVAPPFDSDGPTTLPNNEPTPRPPEP